MGTVPESIDEYYGPQPKYDYTWKGITLLDSFIQQVFLCFINDHKCTWNVYFKGHDCPIIV